MKHGDTAQCIAARCEKDWTLAQWLRRFRHANVVGRCRVRT